MTMTLMTVYDKISTVQDNAPIYDGTGHFMLFIAFAGFVLLSVAVELSKWSAPARWLSVSLIALFFGGIVLFFYYLFMEHQSGNHYETRVYREDIVEQIHDDITEQYSVLAVNPIVEDEEPSSETEQDTFVVDSFADHKHADEWFTKLAADDVFDPALVSVLMEDTQELHTYILRVDEDSDTARLMNIPETQDAPPVEDIQR